MNFEELEALGRIAKVRRELVELKGEGVSYVSIAGHEYTSAGIELALRAQQQAGLPEELRVELRVIFERAVSEAAEKVKAHLKRVLP